MSAPARRGGAIPTTRLAVDRPTSDRWSTRARTAGRTSSSSAPRPGARSRRAPVRRTRRRPGDGQDPRPLKARGGRLPGDHLPRRRCLPDHRRRLREAALAAREQSNRTGSLRHAGTESFRSATATSTPGTTWTQSSAGTTSVVPGAVVGRGGSTSRTSWTRGSGPRRCRTYLDDAVVVVGFLPSRSYASCSGCSTEARPTQTTARGADGGP